MAIPRQPEAVLSLTVDAFQKWKQPLKQGYWKAAKFLRQQSFFSTSDLPYRTQLIPLAAVMALLGDIAGWNRKSTTKSPVGSGAVSLANCTAGQLKLAWLWIFKSL
ncbi:hypothetical protein LC613_39930 [Nostoc sphaeroides CHAB 2801]|uniref:hypothetical protein n=1 Tax=Nostoc sphaeroides TaxID=446679 RepID=UPI001E4304E2|nr:hypothetical protein [Nostoc sphaeroides]MCC5633609.1 hypothetical protein [Nostoc sphaeroides CHAB 2801]